MSAKGVWGLAGMVLLAAWIRSHGPSLSGQRPLARDPAVEPASKETSHVTPRIAAPDADSAPHEVRTLPPEVRDAVRAMKTAKASVLLRSVRRYADCPEILSWIRQEAARWNWDPDPETRAKAEAILAELEMGWETAALSYPNAEVRKRLLENPPRVRLASEPELLDRLVRIALEDASPDLRTAALDGLPTGLGSTQTAQVSLCLSDPDPRVVAAALRALRYAGDWDGTVVEKVRWLAAASDADPDVRKEAARALRRMEGAS